MRSKLFLLLIVFFASCSSNDDNNTPDLQADVNNACTAENPLEVPWMQKLKDSLHCGEYACRVSIIKSTYKEKTVFFTDNTDPACNYQPHLFFFNCEGKMIKELNPEKSYAYLNEQGRESEVLFSCNDSN